MKRLDKFRQQINRALALGPLSDFELPVSTRDGSRPVVVALADEPVSVVLGRLKAVGGHANLFVAGLSEVEIVSVTGIQSDPGGAQE